MSEVAARSDRPSRRRAVLVTVAFSYGSAVFAVLTGIVFVPVYLRYFDLTTYGAWLASGSIASMLGLIDGGLSQVVQQRMASAAGARDHERFAVIAGSSWVLASATVGTVLVAGTVLSPFVPDWVNAPEHTSHAIAVAFALAVAGSGLTIAQTHLFSAAYAWQTPWFAGVTAIVGYGVGVAAIVGGLAAGLEVVALGVGMFARGVVVFLLAATHAILEWRRRKMPTPRVRGRELRDQGRLTAVLFLSRSASLLASNGEAAIIAATIGPRAAATYTLTARVFSVCLMLVNPIAGASFTALAHLRASGTRERVTAISTELLLGSGALSGLVVGTAMAMNASFVSLWLGREAFGGAALNVALGCAALLQARSNLLGQIVPALGAIAFGSGVVAGDALVRVALMLALLPVLGSSAIPLASIAAGVIVTIPAFGVGIGGVLGIGRKRGCTVAVAGWPIALGCIVVGGAIAAGPFTSTSWARFAGELCVVAAVFAFAILGGSPSARRITRGMLPASIAQGVRGAPRTGPEDQ